MVNGANILKRSQTLRCCILAGQGRWSRLDLPGVFMVPIWNDHQAPGSWLIHLYSGNMLVKMCDCPDGTEAPQLQNTRKHVTYLSHLSWWFAKVPGLLQAFQAPLAVLCLKTAYVIGLDAGFIGWLCNSSIFFFECAMFFLHGFARSFALLVFIHIIDLDH